MALVEKKTSTMSVTVTSCSCETTSLSSTSSSSSSVLQQKHPHLVQPLCISPQMVQNNNQGSGNVGVSPTYVKCLHDVSTLKGQLVVLECRVRGTPPLQISWYREDKQIIDSADLRILRKKASSAFFLQ
ncbi:palladin-like [Danio aesculapii]|uniref:palladin-like n=1 Tax=Danio aesculapii TaxID=1142201 RepID=UPI0024BFBAF8|nr:palladin-like [Danio aesculapii]